MTKRSPRGTYLHIADALRAEINDGSEHTTLQSEAELTARFGAARSTVRRALRVLAAEGLIRSQQGACRTTVAGSSPLPTVYDLVVGVITDEGLTPGDSFPPESRLCEMTSASRGTVRRVLAQLEGAGVLEVRQGKGRIVRMLPDTDTSSPTS
ncbi:GntR family transcriptional regulator [Kitasatospora sp. NPDC057015]|uniref:GntR family transcriptional regulator n=1 Tax=Kitasatospora sp. NPDC057015 TaxID=3346001 RepID=UPI0036379FAB